MMHEQENTKPVSASQFQQQKNKEMVISFFEITKLLTKIISHLSLLLSTYVRKNKKNMLALLHIK